MNKHTSVRIGIDMASTAGEKSGLGVYVENVLTAMKQLPGSHEFVEIRRVKKDLRTPMRILWDQVGLPLTAAFKKLDVLFVPAFSAPRFHKPVVMTAHDIIGIIHPEYFSQTAQYYWSRVLPESMKRVQRLLCVSEQTKKDIEQHLHIDPARMVVIPLAANPAFHIVHNGKYVTHQLQKLGITPPFILSVGTLEPRKNYERLIEAFAFTQREQVKLVIVGKKGWGYDTLFEKIRKYHLQNAVVFLEYVTTEQLIAIYNACLFCVLPSVYEGFGLPALEAMQCGAPLVAAQNSSLPEVVGDAGILFDPYDVSEIRERIDLLLTQESLREELQQKSFERAKQFSWQRTAQETLTAIQSVL